MTHARRDINSLSDSELDDYIHAINILRSRSEANVDDEAGFEFQAALHNDGFVGPCEHGSDLFLPWHRAHLYYFEKLLQESDPPRTANVTIPYWDWIHEEAVGNFPQAFFKPGLFKDGRNDGSPDLPPDTLEIVTTETNTGEFGGYPEGVPDGDYGRLERGPHNDMHSRFIVGLMGDPATAALDPIYFSFHCFIDLMWAEWQRRNNSPLVTSPDTKLRGFLTQPLHMVEDFADTVAIGYHYEYTDQLNTAFGIGAPPPPPPPILDMIDVRFLEPLSDSPVATEIERNERVQYRIPAPPENAQRVVIRIGNIAVPISGSYKLRAFIHPHDVAFRPNDAEFADAYGVGYVSMWRAHAHAAANGHRHGGHDGHEPLPHHPSSCTARFNATSVLASLNAADNLVVTLQYTPQTEQEAPDLVREVALNDVAQEVYG